MIGTGGFIDRGTAVQVSCNKLTQFFLFLRDNADTPLDIIVKNKMIQNDSVEIGTQDTQHHRFLIIYQCCGQCHTHTGERHSLTQFHMEIFIHDLRHNIQSSGRCIPVEQNAESHADHQNIAQYIQFLTVRQ